MKTIGIDAANSTMKIFYDGQEVIYRNTIKKLNRNDIIFSFKKDEEIFEYEGVKYEIGKLEDTGSGGRNVNRYISEDYKMECLFAIAKVIGVEDNQIRVVTGIPCSKINDSETIKTIKKMLKNEFMVKVYVNDECLTKVFTVKEVIVVPQPIGTLYSFLDSGKENQQDLNKKYLVIDIGWSTLDLAVLDNGNVRNAYGFDIGTSDYILAVQQELNSLYPEAFIFSINQHELDDTLLKTNQVETTFGKFDAAEIVVRLKADAARKIYQKIMALGLNLNQFTNIILTGGGAQLFLKELTGFFNDPRVIIDESPQIANAKGFYMIGERA